MIPQIYIKVYTFPLKILIFIFMRLGILRFSSTFTQNHKNLGFHLTSLCSVRKGEIDQKLYDLMLILCFSTMY